MTLLLTLLALSTSPEMLADQFRAHIQFLADDMLAGRDTGEEGQKIAAKYLAAQLALYGAEPMMEGDNPYYQPFTLESRGFDMQTTMTLAGGGSAAKLVYGQQFQSMRFTEGTVAGEMIYVGYGLATEDHDSYADLDLKGKWVVVNVDADPSIDAESKLGKALDGPWWRRLPLAKMTDTAGLILIMGDDFTPDPDRTSVGAPGSGGNNQRRPLLMVTPDALPSIFGRAHKKYKQAFASINESGKPASFAVPKRTLDVKMELVRGDVPTENVVGVLRGSDPKLADEYIVISAHYDHVGVNDDGIHNGADDNASGTTAVLMLAKYLPELKPRRSVIFLLASGEELGLLGSRYFVQNPPVPKEQIVGNINLDMISRNEPREMGVIPAKVKDVSTLNNMAYKVNKDAGHGFTFLTNMDRFHRRSDHYNFAAAGIPALFFFAGTHEDYHRPTDDWEKVNFDKLAHFYAFLQDFVVEVANNDNKPRFLEREEREKL